MKIYSVVYEIIRILYSLMIIGIYIKRIINARHLSEIISQQYINVAFHGQDIPLSRIFMPFKINYHLIGLFGLNKRLRYTDIGFHFYLNHLIQRMD